MKKYISLLLSLLLIFCSFSSCGQKEQEKTANILQNIILDKDLVQISELNGIVKIDSITAGLDTYSFDTFILDLDNGDELCSLAFSDGSWISGLTENGFYSMDTFEKELKIYDKKGKISKSKNFSDVKEPMYFSALSEDERFFVYSDSAGSKLIVVSLSDDSKKEINLEKPLRDVLSFKNGLLSATSIDGEVFEIDINKLSCTLAIADNRIKLFSSNYCLGETETNFLLVNKDACYYVPISSASEIILGLTPNGFATVSPLSDDYLIRFYDLEKSKIFRYNTNESVERICYTDKGKILAVVGSSMDKKHKIIEVKPTSSERLTILTQDIVVNTNNGDFEASADLTKTKKLIKDVPLICQFPQYPTGCESVSAVMALNYCGNPISVEDFINDFLPTSRDFYMENGKIFGPSPYEYFIGSPKSNSSYGCMASVINRALIECIGESDRVANLTGEKLTDICENYIENDIPVIVWATNKMLETNPKNSWYLNDETRFTWPGNEHCMLLIGYDESSYYFNDPYTGKTVSYNKTLTEDRFAELGRQAIAILR